MTRLKRCSLPVIVTLLALVGCGPKTVVQPHQRPEEPIKISEGVWQLAWVDPSVVYSDSIFTLIRASRLDSFLVSPGKLTKELPYAAESATKSSGPSGVIKFEAPGGCPVSVLMKGDLVSVHPLSAVSLAPGIYKLTCDLSKTSLRQFPAGPYQVSISCGQVSRSGWLRK
ncbi:MAG: hypothetical protein WAU88_00280 [Candidatus Zixiibacteriota bacterium]